MSQKKPLNLLNHFFSEYQLPILSGVLIGTSYIPFPPWAALFCFVPLWLFCERQESLKKIIFAGWITQFILTFIGFNWVAHTIREFGGLPWIVAILGLLAHCSFANIYVPVCCGIWFYLRKKLNLKLPLSLLVLGLVTALGEIYLQFIFNWNFGYTWMWSRFPIFQVAEYIGFQGISSVIIIANAFLAWAWTLRRELKGKFILIGVMTVFSMFNLWGLVVAHNLPEPNAIVRPLIVQANISNQQKVYAEQGRGFREYIVDKFFALTRKGLEEDQYPDFAMWPETAFPDYLNNSFELNVRRLRRFLKRNQIPLITGAYSENYVRGRDSQKVRKSSNTMYFLGKDGNEAVERYTKSILLAFGEFVPGGETLPILKKMLPMVADFQRGEGPVVREFLGVKFGPQICYESLYPEFTRELANLGAEVIVNVTNDSWFGWWEEPYQHLYMTLARAIEFRRPVIRSTNTGISTVVLASGEVLEKSPIGEEWQKVYVVPYVKQPQATFFQKFFYLVPLLLALSLALIVIWSFKRSKN